VILATLVVAAVLLGFWLIYRLLSLLILLFTAIVIATALNPAVDRLQRLARGRTAAAVVVHLTALGLLLGIVLAMAPLVVQQTTDLFNNLPTYYNALRTTLIDSDYRLLRAMGRDLPRDPFQGVPSVQAEQAEHAAPFADVLPVLSWFGSFFWLLFLVFALFLLSVFWSVEGRRLIQSLLLLIPADRREDGRVLVAEIHSKLGAFVRGQAILCVAVGSMCLVAYLLIGLPYALALAILAGLLEAIPILGLLIATIPTALVGLTMGLSGAVWTIVAIIIVAQIESYLLAPRVMDRSVGVHPIVTLLSITGLAAILGPLGGALAIPLAAVLQVLLRRFVFTPDSAVERTAQSRDQIGVLLYRAHELLDDLHRQLRTADTDKPEFDRAEEDVERLVVDLTAALRHEQAREARA
jgi:predicted PurR-regulated permease PerM